eukprot:4185360-Amphidinium_carterae.1
MQRWRQRSLVHLQRDHCNVRQAFDGVISLTAGAFATTVDTICSPCKLSLPLRSFPGTDDEPAPAYQKTLPVLCTCIHYLLSLPPAAVQD